MCVIVILLPLSAVARSLSHESDAAIRVYTPKKRLAEMMFIRKLETHLLLVCFVMFFGEMEEEEENI